MTHAQLALELDPVRRAAERSRWKASAARLYFGVCQRCRRSRDDDGKPLLVARQERARLFLCFDCARSQRRRGRS